MKYSILCIISCCMVTSLFGQEKVNPVIKSYGGIYAITEATLNVDSELPYTIVVDVMTGSEEKSKVAWGLNNVARMLNLHAVSGADVTKMDVVLAIHGPVTLALLNNEAFQKRFGMENPNVPLLKELKAAGVTLTVCGQSMMSRGVEAHELSDEIEIATSMLTTVTTYQLKGYAVLKF